VKAPTALLTENQKIQSVLALDEDDDAAAAAQAAAEAERINQLK
tara:strand:- start:364 stop:495 length:132 start_codon:yes stop_codon:yes gene_type:complete